MGKNNNISKKIRTIVTFQRTRQDVPTIVIREVFLKKTIPNVFVGQTLTFDHPSLTECLHGTVMNIQHVVYLASDEYPVTYIDVEIQA